jgi:regulator of nonsense transcripts 1
MWKREVLDGIVKLSFKGEIEIELFQYPPPEYAEMEWNLYDCGSTATTKAMMDALKRLHEEREESCGFHRIICGSSEDYIPEQEPASIDMEGPEWIGFNASQKHAIVESCQNELSLIWGPPGKRYN